MPDGAQAWKMIKTPGSQNGRTAQACDRCRSKKIKCDGKRPNCTQCEAVGFECKITDKLTRRAFPRGYTESLEDRVRQLENENSKLTHLLDLKDEQMEMLEKVETMSNHADSQYHPTPSSTNSATTAAATGAVTTSSTTATNSKPASISSVPSLESTGFSSDDDEDAFKPATVETLNADETLTGASTGSIFSQVLAKKLQQKAPNAVLSMQRVFNAAEERQPSLATTAKEKEQKYTSIEIPYTTPPASVTSPAVDSKRSPEPKASAYSFNALNVGSRLLCDQLVTTYFQEWHSMFTIIDQYKFLEEYEKFVNEPDTEDEIFAVTLVLILTLASLSSRNTSLQEIKRLEREWRRLFTSSLQTKPGLNTCKALCLAQLYSLYTHNIDEMWQYRSAMVAMTQRLGLYKCQSRLKSSDGQQLPYYQQEMRRRTFWNVYLLDSFASAALGSPRMVHERDIACRMPDNIDDDGLNEPQTGVNLVSTATCAMSVLNFGRILAKILDTVYGGANQTSKSIYQFEGQLETWKRDLGDNLKFDFANGAPTSALKPVHQKSPLLLMLYHYARVLIHCPLVGAADAPTGNNNSGTSAMQSAKTFIQVFNYLQQRKVVVTLCMNMSRVLVKLSSVVLYFAVDYSRGGALLQDTRMLMTGVQDYVYSEMQNEKPGSVPCQCYQWFEEACDVLLGSLSQGSLTQTDSKPTPRRKSKSPSHRRKSAPTLNAKGTTPATPATPTTTHQQVDPKRAQSVDETLHEDQLMEIMALTSDSVFDNMKIEPFDHGHGNPLDLVNNGVYNDGDDLDALLFKSDFPMAHKAATNSQPDMPNKQDFMDYWDPMQFMSLCDRDDNHV